MVGAMISGITKINQGMFGSRISEGTGGEAKASVRVYQYPQWDLWVKIKWGMSLHHRRVMDVSTSAGRDHLVFVPDPQGSLLW